MYSKTHHDVGEKWSFAPRIPYHKIHNKLWALLGVLHCAAICGALVYGCRMEEILIPLLLELFLFLEIAHWREVKKPKKQQTQENFWANLRSKKNRHGGSLS